MAIRDELPRREIERALLRIDFEVARGVSTWLLGDQSGWVVEVHNDKHRQSAPSLYPTWNLDFQEPRDHDCNTR